MPSQALRASSPRGGSKAGGQSRQPLHSELMVRRKPEDRADEGIGPYIVQWKIKNTGFIHKRMWIVETGAVEKRLTDVSQRLLWTTL